MASALIHIAVASKINKKIKRKESEYLIGSIAPDIAKIVGISRNITHFQDKNKDYPNLDRFLSKYEKHLNNDFVMGYYIHLLTDYFWYKYFFTEIIKGKEITKKDGTKEKLEESELKKLIYSEYSSLNRKVIDAYDLNLKIFYNEVPSIEDIISEIPMDKLDKLLEAMGLIIENDKENKNCLFDINDIETFIKTCTDLINSILEEKGLIKSY